MKIKIHKSTDNQFYWTINGKNGAVVLTSETYRTKASVKRAIKAVQNAYFLHGILDVE